MSEPDTSRPAGGDGAPRVLAYDLLRVLAILSVIAIHALVPYRDISDPAAPLSLLDDLLHFAVPLFVFISGVFIWGRPSATDAGAVATVSRRVKFILVPWLGWTLIYLTIVILRGGAPGSVGEFAGLVLMGPWYHLYFVPMLIALYLLTPVARPIARVSPELLLVGAYLIRLFLRPAIVESARAFGGEALWSFSWHVLTHLPHMALGAWFALRLPRIPLSVRKSWPLMLGAGSLLMTAFYAGELPSLDTLERGAVICAGTAAMLLGLVLGALRLEPYLERYSGLIASVSGLAFGVYLIHPQFIHLIKVGLAGAGSEHLWSQPLFILLTWMTVLIASFASVSLLSRARGLSWLVSSTNTAARRPPAKV